MNVKAIALAAFFFSVFLFYQIRFIVRLNRLKKIRGNVTENGFLIGLPSCDLSEFAGPPFQSVVEGAHTLF